MADFEKVAKADDIEPGQRISVIVDDIPVLLIRVGDDFYAIEDVCTHDGQPLTDGPVEGDEITCPRHGARFNVCTGAAMCMPAIEPVPTFEVEVRDGEVFVGI
ncbi:MAG: biphenyl 2,3-dioxygenase [Planctomycetaceae bacterium]|nr:biphenyl 2,3-dioxygenase [Planctomycetaceae bacterium]